MSELPRLQLAGSSPPAHPPYFALAFITISRKWRTEGLKGLMEPPLPLRQFLDVLFKCWLQGV